jgi:hypothetical protein
MTVTPRLVAGLTGSCVVFGLLALSPAMPVSALEQSNNPLRVTENQTVEKDYGPIAIPNPAPGLPKPAPKTNTPESCRQAAYCDVIPLEVVLPPDLKPRDEFFVTVTLEWETDQLPGIKLGEAEYKKPEDINDLDLYVWSDPPAEQPEVENGGATEKRPEQARLFRPSKGKYSIVVFNYGGPNKGYKLKAEYKKENIVPPFELLPPEVNPVTIPPVPLESPFESLEPETPTPPIVTPVAETPPTTTPAPPAVSKPAPLAPVAIDPDPDFTNFADDAFDEQLAGPSTDVLQEKQVKAVGPPRPASPASLLFWLAIVPLLLLAGGGIWLSKKGSAVLKLR